MTAYIALLRGINVGGHRKVKMADLRLLMEATGLEQVQTYIQSGNLVFKSNKTENVLIKEMEHEIEKQFGFYSSIIIRTQSELDNLLTQCPFSQEETAAAAQSAVGESLYVGLLQAEPENGRSSELFPYVSEKEQGRIIGRDVYMLFQESIRNSRLAKEIEQLGPPVTVRNWKTLNKLADMAKSIL